MGSLKSRNAGDLWGVAGLLMLATGCASSESSVSLSTSTVQVDIETGASVWAADADGTRTVVDVGDLMLSERIMPDDAMFQDARLRQSLQEAHASFRFGVDDLHVVFSQAVRIVVLVPTLADGKALRVRVHHEGDDAFSVQGLSVDADATCDANGGATPSSSRARVADGRVVFYTCGASTFILDPADDADPSNDADLWLRANAGVTHTGDGTNATAWANQIGGGPAVTVNGSPDYNANDINFNPTIEFTISDVPKNGGDFLSIPVLQPYQSLFWVAQLDNVARIHSHLASYSNICDGGAPVGGTLHGGVGVSGTQAALQLPGVDVDFEGAGVWQQNGGAAVITTQHSGNFDLISAIGANTTMVDRFMGGQDCLGLAHDWFGPVGEIIAYPKALTATERQQVESYLAIKYGLTLDNSAGGTAGDYLDTAGTTIWDASVNAAYHNDVAGLGNDTASTLDQRVSMSIDSDGSQAPIVTIATDSDFTSANGGSRTQLTNGQFLIWGHDGSSTASQTTDLDTLTYSNRIAREWKAANTASVGAVNLQFAGFNAAHVLLTDTDGDFSTGAVNAGALGASGEIAGVTLTHGMYFTLARELTVLPSLAVTKTDNDADNLVIGNDIVRYTIAITNNGAPDATGVSAVDTIDADFGTPYNFTYLNCGGSATDSFVNPTLTFSSLGIDSTVTCTITYDVQVDAGVAVAATLANSVDVSAATEGGNDPAAVAADTLTVTSCTANNNVTLQFETDDFGEDTYWSLVPSGAGCGAGSEIANGGNTVDLTCASGGAQSANFLNGYADNSTIVEGPYSLTVGNTYDLHVIDDFGDGITAADPDVRVQQNGADTDTIAVIGTGSVLSFTVIAPAACFDTTSPNVTVNQASSQVDPTTVDSATFTVVFDEPINTGTFTAADITLAGTTGTVTSGPTQIAPNNGTSFQFTVTGMTGGDTVTATIPAGGVQDTSGNTNTASTSTDNQVTYVVCGDGIVSGNEECDDGGTSPGDGCDAVCALEAGCILQPVGYAISQTNVGAGSPANALNAPDAATALLATGDSIDLFFGVAIASGTTITIDAATNNVSNGSMTISESTDGTSFGAPLTFNTFATKNVIEQVTYITTSASVTHIRLVRNAQQISVDSIAFAEFANCGSCGDGSVDTGEECDDNNGTNGDGCSDNCVVDATAMCVGEPSVCTFPPSHTSLGSLRWSPGNSGTMMLHIQTVSQAGAVAYIVDWGDAQGSVEAVNFMALPMPTGAEYDVALPSNGDPQQDAIRLREVDASGATQLVFEGLVPAEGLMLAEPPTAYARARTRTKSIESIGASLSSDTPDSVAIHLPGAGIFAIPLNDLSEQLGVASQALQYEIELGYWGMTAEGVSVPSAFSPEDQMLYIASRWREHPSTGTIAHLLEPIDTSHARLRPWVEPAINAEQDAELAMPVASEPIVQTVSQQAQGTDVIAVSESTAFRGRMRLNAERDEFAGLAAAPPSDQEYWFWTVLDGGSANTTLFEYDLDVEGDQWSTDTVLHTRFFAVPGVEGMVEQTLQLDINGVVVGEVRSRTAGAQTLSFNSAGALKTGTNEIKIRALMAEDGESSPAGYLFLDGFMLEATGEWESFADAHNDPRQYVAAYAEGAEDDTSALPSRVVFDLDENRFIFAADGFVPKARSAVPYWVDTRATLPLLRGFDSASQTTLLDDRVDHLVFAAHGLQTAGVRLSAWRESEGLSSTTVRLLDVFDGFGDGNPDSNAIRAFLMAYRERWEELPTYVVLLGAGSIERSANPTESLASVPPSMTTVPDGIYATHLYLSDFINENDDAMHIGQIPARTLNDAMVVVDKIEHFESLGSEAWAGRLSVMAVGENRGIDFTRVLEALEAELEPRLETELIDVNELPTSERPAAFLDHLRNGLAWFNYIGHGSLVQLGDGPIVTNDDFASLASSLGESGAYTFFTSMSCTTSRSELPGFESIGEKLLMVEQGGAIGVWGPSGTSKPKYTLALSTALGDSLFAAQGQRRLGEITDIAKRQAASTNSSYGEFDLFLLFGDPATRMPSLAQVDKVDPDHDAGLDSTLDADPVSKGCSIQAAAASNDNRQMPWALLAFVLTCLTITKRSMRRR